MEKIYGWSKKIEPLSFTINNTTNLSSNGVQGSIPLDYRLGFSDSHGLEYAPEVGLNKPEIKFIKVLFPPPLLPMSPTTLPCLIFMFKLLKIFLSDSFQEPKKNFLISNFSSDLAFW